MKVGPSTIAYVTDRRIAREICDQNSSISSSRPPAYVAYDLIGDHDHMLFMPYGPKWRVARKLIHQNFVERVVESDYLETVHAEASQMLRDFVLDPDHYLEHPKRFSNSIMMCISKSDTA